MGLVGFGLGLFFGWLLRRERATTIAGTGDRATTALADTSTRLELADQDLVDLRSQLTDAQHLLDERAATIAQLQAELAEFRGGPVVPGDAAALESVEATDEFVDAAADAATAPDTTPQVDEFDIDETEVTDEVVAPPRYAVDEEPVAPEPVTETREPEPLVVADEADREPVAVEEPAAVEVVDEREPVAADVAEPAPVGEEPAVDAVDVVGTPEPVVKVADEGPFVPPPDAQPDDLRRIRGIGPAMERLLNGQGIVTFRQLALLDEAGVAELEQRLPGVPGRVRRDRWVEQAEKLHVETHGDPA
jgi:predicted flap endonuclease-1-like 5' DNA nuclease